MWSGIPKIWGDPTRQIVDGEEYPYPTLELNKNNGWKDLKGYHVDTMWTVFLAWFLHTKTGGVGQNGMCTMFMFDNVPSGLADDPNYRNPKQAGNVRVEIDFQAALNTNLTVSVSGEFENLFEVDGNGAVLYNLHR